MLRYLYNLYMWINMHSVFIYVNISSILVIWVERQRGEWACQVAPLTEVQLGEGSLEPHLFITGSSSEL